MLRASVKAGLDKRAQVIRPEALIPQSTKTNQTFINDKNIGHAIRSGRLKLQDQP